MFCCEGHINEERRNVIFYNLIQRCTFPTLFQMAFDKAKRSKNVSHQKGFERIAVLGI